MPGRRKFHQWAHKQLVDYVTYKAEASGIDVVFVDPRNTSRRCCECGYTSEVNRTKRDQFECGQCGATAHADYNAVARNL